MTKADRIDETSPDMKAELLARLQSVVPEAFSDGQLDLDRLAELAGDAVATGPERYRLTWPGKREAIAMLQARVIAMPPGLPIDDLNTPDLFADCVGQSFDIIGRNGNLVELAVGAVWGEAPHMHSIWIEEQYTDLSFAQLRLSDKMLRFVIDAVEFRIAAFSRVIEDPATSEDDVADAGNDRGLLMAARDYMRQQTEAR